MQACVWLHLGRAWVLHSSDSGARVRSGRWVAGAVCSMSNKTTSTYPRRWGTRWRALRPSGTRSRRWTPGAPTGRAASSWAASACRSARGSLCSCGRTRRSRSSGTRSSGRSSPGRQNSTAQSRRWGSRSGCRRGRGTRATCSRSAARTSRADPRAEEPASGWPRRYLRARCRSAGENGRKGQPLKHRAK